MLTQIKTFLQDRVFHRRIITGDRILFGLIMLFVTIGPFFFIPVKGFSVMSSKGVIALFIGVALVITYGVYVLKKGFLTIPRHKLFWVLLGLVITGFLGSLFSKNIGLALIGYNMETTSWVITLLFAGMIFFAYTSFHSLKRLGVLYGGIITMTLFLIMMHVLRFFAGPAFLNLGVLGDSTATLIGSWGDLGIVLGMVVLLCAMTFELAIGLRKGVKWMIGLVGVLALLVLLVMNIVIVWVVIGLVALGVVLYLFSFAYWDTSLHVYKKTERTPWIMMGVVIISIGALFFGGFFNSFASKYQNITFKDVRPSLSMTLQATGKSLVHNFATGYGPNSFSVIWLLVKPPQLSGTQMLPTEFNQGVGFIPTQIAMNGILSAIAWVLFFGGVFGMLFKKLKQGFSNPVDRYFGITLVFLVMYLGILAWVYTIGHYGIIILAICIGACMALSHNHIPETSKPSVRTIWFTRDPRTSFFGILSLIIIIIGSLVLGYVGFRKTASWVHYTKGLTLLGQGDSVRASNEISLAVAYAPHDIFHQQLVTIALGNMNKFTLQAKNESQDTVSKKIEQFLGVALGHAQVATQLNRAQYKNWILLGDVYRTMVNLGIADAYEKAHEAYTEAQMRNPHDATMILLFAQLALAKGDTDAALGLIKDSLAKYPTTDAYLMRAQIQLDQQRFDGALDSLRSAVGLNPYNPNLNYTYGLLLLRRQKYADAIQAFQRTLLIDRNYAAAYVYLGYAHERSGNSEMANSIYEYVRQKYPNGADAIDRVRKSSLDQLESQITPIVETSADTSKLPEKTPVAPTKKK